MLPSTKSALSRSVMVPVDIGPHMLMTLMEAFGSRQMAPIKEHGIMMKEQQIQDFGGIRKTRLELGLVMKLIPC